MKKYFVDPFLANIPTIDLHGLDRESARIAVLDFINDNIKLKNKEIIIIHGIGKDIVRKEVYNTLQRHKFVLEYKTTYFNRGQTIVRLKEKK